MPNLVNDFEVRKETLRALGGDPTGLANIYEVDLEILKLIGSGGGGEGIPDAPIDGVQYARQNGEWTPVESGLDWNIIKQKLAEDGVESIKFIMGEEEVILTASEVKTLLNQTVLPDAPIDGKQYARQNGNWTPVEEGLTDAPSDGKQYARQDGAWTVVESGGSVTPEGKYMTITVDKSNSGETIISPTVTGSLPNLNLQYRINNGSWNDFIVGTTADIHVVAGDFVQFKGVNKFGISTSTSDYLNFGISGNPVALSGNVMSLIDGVGDTKDIPDKFCFFSLFKGSNVKTVSSDFLPATELTDYCYCAIFQGCSNLVQSPELPATVMKIRCYYNMFWGCSNLVQSPELPSTVLAGGCYYQMFYGCSNLVQSPELPSNELVGNCYVSMFHGCSKLNYVKSLAVEGFDSNNPLEDWLNGVSSSGTFEKPAGVVYKTGSSGIPEGWTVKEFDMYIEAPKDGKQYARQDGAWTSVKEGLTDAPSDGKTYGRNNGNWTPVEEGLTDAPSDGKQYARQDGAWTSVKEGLTDAPSDGTQYARQNGAWTPVQTPSIGKYMTLTADKSNSGETIIHPNIEGSLPNLNLQYRINNGKWNDFIVGATDDIKIGAGDVLQFKGDNKEGVSNNGTSGYNTLNFAISGNPVALSGNIMSLIDGVGDALEIPNDYCFLALFRNSAAIKTVSSDFLPATTLKSSCYRDLFSGCQNLTKAPELPATTLADGCYHGMFYGCKSLVTAPELPAKVLVEGCYGYMFNGSTSLNYLKCLATEGTINGDGTVPSALDNWLQGVASTGTFEKLSGVSYEAGGNGIPEGWTVKEIYDYVEAPMDGNQYARQDGTWTVVESGGSGITDAPSDGKQYTRQSGTWVEVSKVKTTNNTTMQFWNGTQQEYDAITTKDANTLYIIK